MLPGSSRRVSLKTHTVSSDKVTTRHQAGPLLDDLPSPARASNCDLRRVPLWAFAALGSGSEVLERFSFAGLLRPCALRRELRELQLDLHDMQAATLMTVAWNRPQLRGYRNRRLKHWAASTCTCWIAYDWRHHVEPKLHIRLPASGLPSPAWASKFSPIACVST